MKIHRDMLCVGRILNEDAHFVTLEVAKRDDVSFTLQKDESGETVGGDQFLTVLFVHKDDDGMAIWKPWEDES
jgi:hypothetical protein